MSASFILAQVFDVWVRRVRYTWKSLLSTRLKNFLSLFSLLHLEAFVRRVEAIDYQNCHSNSR